MTKAQAERKKWAIETLEGQHGLRPGDTIWGCVRTVARSGMSRTMTFHVPDESGRGICDITYAVGALLGEKLNKRGAIMVPGCGMDMIFKMVYDIGRTMYPNGFDCANIGALPGSFPCHSNDHHNGREADKRTHHADGGYAFQSRSL